MFAFIERIRLLVRARKYKNRNDRGGIAYILTHIQEGQTCLDIGAHKGAYLYFMQKSVGKTGKCYGFEPQISLFDYLQHLKKSLKWKNVHFENIALSDKESVMDFFIPQHRKDATSPGATLVAHADKKDWLQVEVQTNTLDQYCSTHEIRPDFLKIDVEGNEWEVLKGGEKILKQYKPKILVEIEARHIGKEKAVLTFEYLLELGYKGYFINDSEKLPLTQWDFERYQTPGREPYCNNFIFE